MQIVVAFCAIVFSSLVFRANFFGVFFALFFMLIFSAPFSVGFFFSHLNYRDISKSQEKTVNPLLTANMGRL